MNYIIQYFCFSGQDQAYVSKWFAFDRMKFLMDKSEPNETRDSSNVSLFIFIIYTDIIKR